MMEYRDSSGGVWAIRLSGNPARVVSASKDGEDYAGLIGASVEADQRPDRIWIERDGECRLAHIALVGDSWWVHIDGTIVVVDRLEPGVSSAAESSGALVAPMPGKVLEVHIAPGQSVRQGDTLLVLEAMKMEHRIEASADGSIIAVHFQEGAQVDAGTVLVEINQSSDEEE